MIIKKIVIQVLDARGRYDVWTEVERKPGVVETSDPQDIRSLDHLISLVQHYVRVLVDVKEKEDDGD